jgi:phosphotransferase system HPr (HPr) family protein
METTTITVTNAEGLHARPAHLFVSTAGKYDADVQVRSLTGESEFVNAKSILSVLTLGVSQGHEIELRAEGEDEGEAVQALRSLIEGGFEEG